MNKSEYLYVGCGNHRLKGFTHADISVYKAYKNRTIEQPEIICDITKKIPLKNKTVKFIFSRDTLEHLTWKELINHFIECNRILKENGIIRMSFPSFDKMIERYKNKDEDLEQAIKDSEVSTLKAPIENHTDLFISRILYHDHYYLHNFDTMNRALSKCGFTDIQIKSVGDTSVSEIKDEILKSEITEQKLGLQIEAKKSNKNIDIKKFDEKLPGNFIKYFLVKYFNIDIKPFYKRKPMFPNRYWFLEKIILIKKKLNR